MDAATNTLTSLQLSRKALERAISAAGGQESLGAALDVPQSTISYWLNGSKTGIAAGKVLKIEELYGIPRHEQRPDLYPAPAEQRV
jgi:DNA-binding transcriptional regulator YdaS (Cro superfamily)